MPDDLDDAGGEVSDGLSDNEYDDDDMLMKDDPDAMADHNDENGGANPGEVKKKYDPKDPLRPRRKKARRACYACQRAHLTCGDERPCQRCIKRGLADACQDGVRKKAKYLHDAPPEALGPVLGPNFNTNPTPTRPNGSRHHSGSASDVTSNAGSSFFSQSTNPSFPVFTGGQQSVAMPDSMTFPSQTSPVSPSFPTPVSSVQQTPVGMPVSQVNDPMGLGAFFDPSNPAIFNFDLEGMNFGSQYGALEFGMLGQMSSGAAETPPRENSISQASDVAFGFGNGTNPYSQVYDSGMITDFLGGDQASNGLIQHGLPHAYAIPTANNLHSPSTDNTASPQPPSLHFEGSPTSATYGSINNSQGIGRPHHSKVKPTVPKAGPQNILGKRQRDPSAIYETVKEPYPYLNGFHNLIAFLQKRFPSTKTLRIAKSLASIRPSFISCTKTLNRQDLIFMEKCFQRTLFEYEDFMQHCSAPTIVCRRTGEVAAVNKEFTALTGWTKEVLLGKDPNQNVNTGGSDSGSAGNTGRAGLSTPRLKSMSVDSGKVGEERPQAVFIAELLDDDSVIEFYEDFASLAFGDSRGSVTRKCRVLKYRTKDNMDAPLAETTPQKGPRNSILSSRVTRIDGEHGIAKIEKDGKVDCTCCWTIRRDVFDIPMLIVMNFLPCYYANKEPHQLAI